MNYQTKVIRPETELNFQQYSICYIWEFFILNIPLTGDSHSELLVI